MVVFFPISFKDGHEKWGFKFEIGKTICTSHQIERSMTILYCIFVRKSSTHHSTISIRKNTNWWKIWMHICCIFECLLMLCNLFQWSAFDIGNEKSSSINKTENVILLF